MRVDGTSSSSGATPEASVARRRVRAESLDGSPLAPRTLERDARRRSPKHELEVHRQRAGLAPITSDVVRRPPSAGGSSGGGSSAAAA
jgi:hypothetical protein